MKIWVVSHCEIWQTKPRVLWDEMIHHVASSLEKAEAYMKPLYILEDAWWKVYEFTLDSPEDEDSMCQAICYGTKGRKLKHFTPRYNKAIKAFEKENPTGGKT